MPGTVNCASEEPISKVVCARLVVGFIILGVVLRLVRCLLNYPMWCDETMLAANLLDRPWTALAQPLAYRQVCPLGFLALEWIVVQLIGFSEPSLRLIPVVCAIVSVPLFCCLARRALGDRTCATVLAVAIFAVSEPPIRYAAEVKPYSADLLVSLLLLYLAVAWLQSQGQVRLLCALAAAMPFVVSTSLPSIFVIGAIAIVGLVEVRIRFSYKLAASYMGFVGAAGLAMGCMAALGQYHAAAEDRNYLINFWIGAFPPSWRDPAALGGWLVRAHTGPLFAYPHGANRLAWLTVLIFGFFIWGIVLEARRNLKIVLLLVLPFLLVLAAAALRRYPYGMSVRVAQFLVPSTLLLAAVGLGRACMRARRLPLGRWAIPALTVVLAAMGFGRLWHDLVAPYRTPWDRTARDFARWFWDELSVDAELVCVRTDLGIPLRPEPWAYDAADQYLCLQRIYSRRHRRRRPPDWDKISAERPLRCVLLNRMPTDVPDFLNWIETHRDRYRLRDVRTYPASRGSRAEPAQTYVVCEFTPAASVQTESDHQAERTVRLDRAALGRSATRR
jgi:hypothetical protein